MVSRLTSIRGLLGAASQRDFREPSPLSEVFCPDFQFHKPGASSGNDRGNSRNSSSTVSEEGKHDFQAAADAPTDISAPEFDEDSAFVDMILGKRIRTLPGKDQRALRYRSSGQIYALVEGFGDKEWRELTKRVIDFARALVRQKRERNERKKRVLNGKKVFSESINAARLDAALRGELYRLLKYDQLERRVLVDMVKEINASKSAPSLEESLRAVSSKTLNNPKENASAAIEKGHSSGENIQADDGMQPKSESNVEDDQEDERLAPELERVLRQVEIRDPAVRETNPQMGRAQRVIVPTCQNKKKPQRKTIFILNGSNATPRLMTDILGLFTDLRMPIKRRYGFLLKYSSEGKWKVLAQVVKDWKLASKWIATIEHMVGVTIRAQTERVNPADALRDGHIRILESCDCYISMAKLFGVTTQVWIYTMLERAFPYIQNLLLSIQRQWDDVVTFQGHNYLEARVVPFLEFNARRKRTSDRYCFTALDQRDAADTSFDIKTVAKRAK